MRRLEFLLEILTSVQPWIGLWLLAVGLDMVFGGPRALAILPGMETAISKLWSLLEEQGGQRRFGPRLRYIMGVVAGITLLTGLAAAGWVMNGLAFNHPAISAIAVVLLARSVGMKPLWSSLPTDAQKAKDKDLPKVVSGLTQQFALRHVGGAAVFLSSGFSGLWPYIALLVIWDHTLLHHRFSDISVSNNKASEYTLGAFLRLIARPILSIAGILGAWVLALAILLKPGTLWGKALIAVLKPSLSLLSRPLLVMACGHGWSMINTNPHSPSVTWVGPKTGRAKLNAKDLANALIVTLVAFAVLNGFLLLTWLAIASR